MPQSYYLIIDELFQRSLQAECRSVPMTPMEIVMVLEALDCVLLQPREALAVHFAAPEREAFLSVPLLSAPALAAFLNAFSQEHRVTAATVSLPAAERASARMVSLITHPYETGSARQALLSLCCGYTTLIPMPHAVLSPPPASSSSSSSSSCWSPSASLPPFSPPAASNAQPKRPSLWPAKAVRLLCESLSLPLRLGGGEGSSLASATGLTLLSTEPPEARAAFGIRPSLLLLRYAVYRHVLVLLEQWWGEGDDAGGWALAPWLPCPGLDSRGRASLPSTEAAAQAAVAPVVRQVVGFTALERGLASMSRAHAWVSAAGGVGVGADVFVSVGMCPLFAPIYIRKLTCPPYSLELENRASRCFTAPSSPHTSPGRRGRLCPPRRFHRTQKGGRAGGARGLRRRAEEEEEEEQRADAPGSRWRCGLCAGRGRAWGA